MVWHGNKPPGTPVRGRSYLLTWPPQQLRSSPSPPQPLGVLGHSGLGLKHKARPLPWLHFPVPCSLHHLPTLHQPQGLDTLLHGCLYSLTHRPFLVLVLLSKISGCSQVVLTALCRGTSQGDIPPSQRHLFSSPYFLTSPLQRSFYRNRQVSAVCGLHTCVKLRGVRASMAPVQTWATRAMPIQRGHFSLKN